MTNYGQNVYNAFVTKDEFKKLRESIGYTQAKLSEEMEITIRTITRWENGEVEIPKVVELALRSIVKKETAKGRR